MHWASEFQRNDIYLVQIYLDIGNLLIVVRYHQWQPIVVECMNLHIEIHLICLVSKVQSRLVPANKNTKENFNSLKRAKTKNPRN